MLWLHMLVYGLALWLGLYLLARPSGIAGLRWVGVGLVVYAVGLAIDMVGRALPEGAIISIQGIIALGTALCWSLALYQLFGKMWQTGLPIHRYRLVFLAGMFFAFSCGLLFLPQPIFNSDSILVAIGLDLLFLGYAIARLDAFSAGELLWPDMRRSFITAVGLVGLFGGQVGALIWWEGAISALSLTILATIIATALIIAVIGARLAALLDVALLPRTIGDERAQLQAIAEALPRRDIARDMLTLDAAEFTRLTRRALSAMGDLRRLAASPLTRLPIITRRLKERNASDSTLERAAELKALLAESIARLKPRESHYGTSEAWRYYNALYYPYVVGVRPYTALPWDETTEEIQQVMRWFQTQVPERTLHNWQNAAAELIAQDLREQNATKA